MALCVFSQTLLSEFDSCHIWQRLFYSLPGRKDLLDPNLFQLLMLGELIWTDFELLNWLSKEIKNANPLLVHVEVDDLSSCCMLTRPLCRQQTEVSRVACIANYLWTACQPLHTHTHTCHLIWPISNSRFPHMTPSVLSHSSGSPAPSGVWMSSLWGFDGHFSCRGHSSGRQWCSELSIR